MSFLETPALYLFFLRPPMFLHGGGWSDSQRGGPWAEVSCHSHQQAMAAEVISMGNPGS